MKIFYYELAGVIGFIISGLISVAAGMQNGDYLTTIGSIIWTIACVIWMIPILSRRNSQR